MCFFLWLYGIHVAVKWFNFLTPEEIFSKRFYVLPDRGMRWAWKGFLFCLEGWVQKCRPHCTPPNPAYCLLQQKSLFSLTSSMEEFFCYSLYCCYSTPAIAKKVSVKNTRAWVSMDFTWDKYSAPRTFEKIKILGAVLELPAKQLCQSSPFTSKWGQIGQVGSVV